MKVAVVGATGLVGSKMLEVLEERGFPVTELFPVASPRSYGRKVKAFGKEWTVVSPEEAIAAKPAVAIFSAGGAASGELAPKFAAAGCYVVDNSSFWRMDPAVPLVDIDREPVGGERYCLDTRIQFQQRRKGEKVKRHKGEEVKREGSPNKSLHICLLFLLKDKKVSHYY